VPPRRGRILWAFLRKRQDSITNPRSRRWPMAKSKLQSMLVSLSVVTATLNVVGLVLSNVNLSQISNGYLAPVLVGFGFIQSVLVVTNHLRR